MALHVGTNGLLQRSSGLEITDLARERVVERRS